jgi:hypothetical protein
MTQEASPAGPGMVGEGWGGVAGTGVDWHVRFTSAGVPLQAEAG